MIFVFVIVLVNEVGLSLFALVPLELLPVMHPLSTRRRALDLA